MLCHVMAFRKVIFAVALMACVSNASSVKCQSDLEDALSLCNAPSIQTLLNSYPAQKTCHLQSGHGQPLHLVGLFFCSHAGDDCFDVFQVLLDHGADPNAKNPKNGMTVAHMLINEWDLVIGCNGGTESLKRGLRLLISHGADFQAVDERRRSVVDIARSKGAGQDIIDLLEGKKEASGDGSSVIAAEGSADGDAVGEGEESGNTAVVAAVVGVAVFLKLVAATVYLRKKARDRREPTSKSVVTTAPPMSGPLPVTVISSTTQGSQEVRREASGRPAPMIILAAPHSSEGP